MHKQFFVMLLLAFASIMPAQAQHYYDRDFDLRSGEFVPLFNCEILSDSRDRRACQDLAYSRYNRDTWENGGDVVSCRSFRRHDQMVCYELARNILFSQRAFDCSYTRGRDERRQCELTRRAYGDGGYRRDVVRDYDRTYYGTGPVNSSSSSTVIYNNGSSTTTTVTSTPGAITTATTTCGPAFYDQSYSAWKAESDRLRSRGRTRTAIGIGAMIGGALLGTSRDSTVRAIGGVAVVGGAVMTALGLVDLSESNLILPHMRQECTTSYVRETRRVVIDQQRCTSTRYTEQGFGSSRSYYEVNCSTKRYVTYDRLDAWETSTEIVY